MDKNIPISMPECSLRLQDYNGFKMTVQNILTQNYKLKKLKNNYNKK